MKILHALYPQSARETAPDAGLDTLKPFADAFAALDLAIEISRKDLILSTGYPKIVTTRDAHFIVIRWGLCPRYQSFLEQLRRRDPRFHACPPLSSQDAGMIECYDK